MTNVYYTVDVRDANGLLVAVLAKFESLDNALMYLKEMGPCPYVDRYYEVNVSRG